MWETEGVLCLAVDKSRGLPLKLSNSLTTIVGALTAVLSLLFGLLLFSGGLFEANPYFILMGFVFIGIGYLSLFRVGRLTVDKQNRKWTLRRGVFPFVQTERGTLDDAAIYWEMAPINRFVFKGSPPCQFWSLRLVGAPTKAPDFLEMTAFDLRRDYVGRDVAQRTYEWVVECTDLPLYQYEEEQK